MKDSVIPITLIEYAYRHRALDILQLYWLLQDKEFLLDHTTKKQLVKKLKISETTLSRRIVKLKRLHFIQRSAKENYYQITPPSHILSKKELKRKGKLLWDKRYRIHDFKIITITALLYQQAFIREVQQHDTTRFRQYRQRFYTKEKKQGWVLRKHAFKIPVNYFTSYLGISLTQYYRYREQARKCNILSFQRNYKPLFMIKEKAEAIKEYDKKTPFFIQKDGTQYIQEKTTTNFNLIISL